MNSRLFTSNFSRASKRNIALRETMHCGIPKEPSSAVGQNRTKRQLGAMSALPLKADKAQTCRHVRLYGAIGVKAGVNSISLFDLTATISSSRPNFPWPLPRSGRQGSPKAIAKRLALDGREHSGRLVGLGRPIPVKVSFRTCFLARFNVANYDDTEGSSPSGASIAPQTCIRSIREDRNHDAVMRIGGEAPRRRAHSKAR